MKGKLFVQINVQFAIIAFFGQVFCEDETILNTEQGKANILHTMQNRAYKVVLVTMIATLQVPMLLL
jgi:hypothetical protein